MFLGLAATLGQQDIGDMMGPDAANVWHPVDAAHSVPSSAESGDEDDSEDNLRKALTFMGTASFPEVSEMCSFRFPNWGPTAHLQGIWSAKSFCKPCLLPHTHTYRLFNIRIHMNL